MRPEISEFSYGYVLTESIVRNSRLPINAAPVFPSLSQEGQEGGGYDVSISIYPYFLLFLQFKLSHYMVGKNAFEVRNGLLPTPFYRVYLMPLKYSDQHNLLLELELEGNLVYYAAPKFHLTRDLNEAYLNNEVIKRSFFVRPGEIGTLPDDERHYISFRNGSPVYMCSRPQIIRRRGFFSQSPNGTISYNSKALIPFGLLVNYIPCSQRPANVAPK